MRFLIIDDNAADRELIIRQLQKEFHDAEFTQVGRPTELEAVFAQAQADFVLTDYQLNWANGLQIFERVKKLYPDVPVVMFTGTGSEEVAVEALRAGVNNYVLKKHLDRLPIAVRESLEKTRLRKQYEEAISQLQLSEELYREIFEQGLTGVFAVTPEGKLLTCNPAFARIFGFASVEQALEANLSTLYGEPEKYASFVQQLSQEKRLEYSELELLRRDGSPVYIVANVVGSFDTQGKLKEFTGYFFDNTERHRLAGQLQQAQKLESVGLLVSGIAHDFNNMLGSILGYSSRGLSRISTSHPLYNNLAHIHEIATGAAKMTQQLLAFSRRQVLEPTDVDLNKVVKNLLEFLGKVLADHIDIMFVPDPELHTVHVDYAQIEQVVMNLCINARDAMAEGGRLTIRTRNVGHEEAERIGHGEMPAEAYVLLTVQDTGIGMDEQTRSRIFEPFFTTKEVGKGTGLGLSMVHGIVGQHNGYISVDSQVGKGTAFNIYLPAVDVMHTLPLPYLQGASEEAQEVRGGDETILVVEDDPDLRYLMEEALGDYGYTVMSARDGVEGLQLFEKYKDSIALVISDLVTPKMKGKELYDYIHAMSAETHFLFVSGYHANQISQNFVLDKGFVFLQKPFDLDDLAAKVREILVQ
ncbi:hybrid sensor histidine kinase/response regulator [Ktedonobacter racemifer]|uniref:histidine kinase n=1 Tax=Ktedonobacter racemifer DSM 44963 TaxID=485913 RepID=D6TJI7_KTERA|nr:hybrid sensor histidine kinase/response regulator [Ktedonobacter racemifer]EFH89594.1 multi-sensor hybrid histidine kinase [Ktedonobacter racemifer DSM 44963]